MLRRRKAKGKIGDLEKVMLSEINQLPWLRLEEILRRKLEAAGAPECVVAAKEIVQALREGRESSVRWERKHGETEVINIEFTDDELNEVVDSTVRFVEESLPPLMAKVRKTSARSLSRQLIKDWPDQWAWQQETHAAFCGRLEEHWGEAFSYLRMLQTCSREIGGEVHARWNRWPSKKDQHRRDVLLRLHVRGVQVAAEILCLMDNGFADGAMARWRTLHEITVVATLIADHDDDLAKRYLDHEVVESKRALDLHREYQAMHGLPPIEDDEAEEIDRRFETLKAQYGKAFVEGHGWAAHHLNFDGRQFSVLEKAAEKAGVRPYYKMASYNVHAGAKGIAFRLGLWGSDGFLAGSSNAGFVDPGERTAFSLTQLTGLLFADGMDLEIQIQMESLMNLRDKVGPALEDADRLLRRKEEEFRRKLERELTKGTARPRRRRATPSA